MGFLNTDSMPRLVEKLSDGDNIRISGNSKGNRVGTVVKKIVEKADDVTKAIEQEVVNNSYSFKVGTGDVDVSTDVQDGFGEVGVKGVTYQNILGTRINTSDGVEKNNNIITFNKVAQTQCTTGFPDSLAQVDKTYTLIFDILENTIENPANGNVGKINIVSYNSGNYFIKYKETGHKKILLKQPATSTCKPYIEFYNSTSGKFVMTVPILLEGNHVDNPNIPSKISNIVGVGDKSKNLFNNNACVNGFTLNATTGIVTEKNNRFITDFIRVEYGDSIFIQTYDSLIARNLWGYDLNKEPLVKIHNDAFTKGTFVIPKNVEYIRIPIAKTDDSIILDEEIKKAKILISKTSTSYEPYYDGHKIEILSNGDNIYDYTKITDNTYINTSGDIVNYTGWFSTDYIRVNKNKKYYFYNQKHRVPFAGLYCYYYDTNKNKIEYLNLGDTEFVGLTEFVSKHDGYIRLSGLSHSIQVGRMYASYDKTQILLDEPLMRLPNGICDEITRDGKLIRRVGKVVFDGSERWTLWYESSKTIGFIYNHNSIMNKSWYSPQVSLICDRFISKNGHSFNEDDSKAITQWNANNSIFIRINKSSLETLDVNGFKQWLSQNPTTVYYELSTPVITELPAPYLRIFKDGHLTFNTLVAPESTHVVQLNKSAQIERSIREVQGLDSRVKKLESFYDEMILETSHKLNLLTYDFEYTKERNCE